MSGTLERRRDASGEHHVLRRRRVEPGATLELLLDDMTWVRGRYQWGGGPDERPRLLLSLPGASNPVAVVELPDEAILRWPSSEPTQHRLRQRGEPRVCGLDDDDS